MSIGENIKRQRKLLKITQVELAKLINKSTRMLQKYENNEVSPPIDVLMDIANSLDTNVFKLLDDDNFYGTEIKHKGAVININNSHLDDKDITITNDFFNGLHTNIGAETLRFIDDMYGLTEYLNKFFGVSSPYGFSFDNILKSQWNDLNFYGQFVAIHYINELLKSETYNDNLKKD